MADQPKMGRPSTFTEETAAAICAKLAEGESLRSICRDDDMPGLSTVFQWLAARPVFAEQYARAREAQADALFEDILEIADDGRNDWMERRGEDDAGWVVNGEHLQRSRLRIDARKWMAGKLRPKTYGDKSLIEGPGENGEHLHKVTADAASFASAIASLTQRARAAGVDGGEDAG